MKIQISKTHTEAKKFVNWLISNGYDAELGNTTRNFVNGVWTAIDKGASDILVALWDIYCKNNPVAA